MVWLATADRGGRAESGLTRYLQEIRRFPMLERNEEYMLAQRWRGHGDREAAHKLVTSHLRLVAKIAMGFRGYNLPISEAVSEGNVGLMQALERFEPEKGFRLSTYATWWIKASIQEYILRSWSLVKMGTTANQKKLFFNLRTAPTLGLTISPALVARDKVGYAAANSFAPIGSDQLCYQKDGGGWKIAGYIGVGTAQD